MKKPKLWGDYAVTEPPAEQLPVADHIQGALVQYGADGKPLRVGVQYRSGGQYYVLNMSFLDTMALLSMLRGIQLDEGFQLPDDPRAPSAR